jgi:hypothetical protein
MRRFHVIRGGLSHPDPSSAPGAPVARPDDPMARRLRSIYAPPSESYWDGFEARVMAAVRVGRAAPVAAVEWWQTLARWARPGFAAAAVLIGMVGGIALQSRGAESDAAYRAVLDPGSIIAPLDDELARVMSSDSPAMSESARADARAASELLSDGVKRRTGVNLSLDVPPATADSSTMDPTREAVKARREATFRYVMP